jgi:hypothetical protein
MSSAWQRFRRLSPLERSMFFRTVFLLPVTVVALRVAGLRNVERRMDSRGKRKSVRAKTTEPEWQFAESARRMTEAASRHGIARGNCLSKSMVLWHLLRWQGLEATLHVGGRKDGVMFKAHAWVELDGVAINDSADVRERFVPFECQMSGGLNAGMSGEE